MNYVFKSSRYHTFASLINKAWQYRISNIILGIEKHVLVTIVKQKMSLTRCLSQTFCVYLLKSIIFKALYYSMRQYGYIWKESLLFCKFERVQVMLQMLLFFTPSTFNLELRPLTLSQSNPSHVDVPLIRCEIFYIIQIICWEF